MVSVSAFFESVRDTFLFILITQHYGAVNHFASCFKNASFLRMSSHLCATQTETASSAASGL